MADLFLDGRYIGSTKEPEKLVAEIKQKRRNGVIPNQINVAFHKSLDEVKILSDSGRTRRPLIVVEGGKPKLTQEHLEKLKTGDRIFGFRRRGKCFHCFAGGKSHKRAYTS